MQKIRRTRKNKRQTLRNTYGSVILPKGLILYHTSSYAFEPKKKGPMIFFTFHPSEWTDIDNDLVTKVELTKTLRVFFMVKTIIRGKVISLLNTLTNSLHINGKDLNKRYNKNLECYIPYLEAENLDGWVSTIENRVEVEIALINIPENFKVLSTERIKENWSSYSEYNRKKFNVIHTHQFPIKLHIHKKYKTIIEDYMRQTHYYVFQVVLNNAQIEYFDGPDKDILWKC